ncbi:MAG: hypothetical protein QXI09_01950 [Candidatus Aenigmatarchaeota archaeon]
MGRRPYRQIIYNLLLSILSEEIPQNIEAIRRHLSIKIGKELSWNTVKKYVDELVEMGKVDKIQAGKILMYKKRV